MLLLAEDVEPIADQPSGVIDVLDGSFVALRQRARTMVTVVAGLVIPLSLFQGWIARNALGGATFGELLDNPELAQELSTSGASQYDAGFFLSIAFSSLVASVAGVAIARVVFGWFRGDDVSASDALRYTGRRAVPVLGAFLLVHLVELIGAVLFILPFFAAVVLCSLTSPVLAIEDLGPVAAVRRSWALVRRRPGPVVAIIALVGLVNWGVSTAVGTVPELGALVLGPDRAWLLVSLANTLASLILTPILATSMTLMYMDIRFRTEGLDIARRIEMEFGASRP